MADNFDNYSMKVQARVDLPSNKDIDAQIRKLEKSISKLKVSGQFDDTALRNLTNQLNTLKASITTANFSPTALSELTSQVEKALGNIQISAKVGQEVGSSITKGMQQNIDSGIVADIKKISDASTSAIVQNEKKKQDAYRATTETVMYHAGVISKLNKAETNGRFYGSSRGTGYFGTGHYFVDSATKHELDNNSSYSKLPYTSIDISKYDNLFKANTDEIANRLHSFLENLTKFTQGSDVNSVSELFSQFRKVFGDTVMDIQEFDAKLEQLKSFMQNSNMSDRSDSVSTQFMKSLGYGGVDTRGTKYADTRYGTVIYDLKEESVLQANITDELQKQGQMLEKINYEKGQVFDKTEDSRIQSIIDQQAKSKEIETEFDKLFDSTKLKAYESELDSVNETLKKNDDIISDCQHAINNADEEAKKFAKDMANLGLEMSEDEIKSQADDYRVTFQERIDELEKERPLLESRKKQLEENLNAEYELANVAREQARQIVDERHKEVQSVQEVSDKIKSFSELKIKSNDFINIDGLTKAEDILEKVRTKYEQFGQVTFKNIELDADGNLKSFRVNIQQTNGDLKETRNFLMEISDDAKKVKFSDDTIKGTENVVRHLNEQKDATDQIIKEEEKLINAMADVREKSEQARQAEEKRQELAQNKAINKALEEEYNQKQKIIAQEEKLAQATAEKANKIQLSMGVNGDTTSKIEVLRNNFTKLGLSADEVKTKMSGVDAEVKTLQSLMNSGADNSAIVTQFEKLQTVLTHTQNNLKQTRSDYSLLATEQQRLSLANTIEAWNQKNTRATKEVRAENDRYVASLRDLNTEMTKMQFGKIQTGFKQNENSMRTLNRLGASLKDQMKQAANSFTQWISVSSAIMAVIYQLQRMPQKVRELDDAVTDFTMATGANKAQVSELIDTYADLGDELKSTVTDVTISATEWLKQGKSIAETETLIRDAMILSKVGKLSSAESTKYLTSVMKSYKVAADDTLGVVDKLSAVDMASATDVGGLAEGIGTVANNARLAGVSMDKLLGYLAAVGEVSQEGMSSVGTAYNAIFARMGNIKLSRLKDYETGEDLSNVETVLKGVGIQLRDSQNSFRDFDEVLDETASRWTSFSEVQQRAIANAFAGTHHVDSFITLMENYDNALEYAQVSMNSSGQAMEKFEAYQDSLAGHTEELENAFIKLSNTFVSSDFLKGLVDLGTTGVKAIDGLVSALTPLGAIGVIGGGILGAKNAGREKCHPSYHICL